MEPYKSKVIHIEYDILNLSLIRHNINAYPIKGKNFFGDSSIVILDDKHVRVTIITGNIDNNVSYILENRDSVLSYLHIAIHTGN